MPAAWFLKHGDRPQSGGGHRQDFGLPDIGEWIGSPTFAIPSSCRLFSQNLSPTGPMPMGRADEADLLGNAAELCAASLRLAAMRASSSDG